MCTSSNYIVYDNVYFGRNFDYEISYNECVVFTPRDFVFEFRDNDVVLDEHYAIIGIGAGVTDYPLYYDAMNEHGLCISGLNFQDNAKYNPVDESSVNIASFEFIPYILSKCKTVKETKKVLETINITDTPYSNELPPSPLHWHINDKTGENIVVEQTNTGLQVYDNPIGVLTNNPTFPHQLSKLDEYRQLSNHSLGNNFDPTGRTLLKEYSRGMGAIGLPGDLSSSSRFVRVAWTRMNSYTNTGKNGEITQFFHILKSVEQTKGCTLVTEPNKYEYTIYTDCYDTNELTLHYQTYDNFNINHISLESFDLNGDELTYKGL